MNNKIKIISLVIILGFLLGLLLAPMASATDHEVYFSDCDTTGWNKFTGNETEEEAGHAVGMFTGCYELDNDEDWHSNVESGEELWGIWLEYDIDLSGTNYLRLYNPLDETNKYYDENINQEFLDGSYNPSTINSFTTSVTNDHMYGIKKVQFAFDTSDYMTARVFYYRTEEGLDGDYGATLNTRDLRFWSQLDANYFLEYYQDDLLQKEFSATPSGVWTAYNDLVINSSGYNYIHATVTNSEYFSKEIKNYNFNGEVVTETISANTMRDFIELGDNTIRFWHFENDETEPEMIYSMNINYDPTAEETQYINVRPLGDWTSSQDILIDYLGYDQISINVNNIYIKTWYDINPATYSTLRLNTWEFEDLLFQGNNSIIVHASFENDETMTFQYSFYYDNPNAPIRDQDDPEQDPYLQTPERPEDANVFEAITWGVDYAIYIFRSLGQLMSNAISSLTGLIGQFGTLILVLTEWFSFLPTELISVLVLGLTLSVIVSVIRIFRGA